MAKLKKRVETTTVTISAAGTKSGEVFLIGELVGLRTDSAFDTGDITFETALASGGTFITVKDSAGSSIQIDSVAASDHRTVSGAGVKGLSYIKLVSSVTQGDETVITLITEARD
jgi:hypothetical protein